MNREIRNFDFAKGMEYEMQISLGGGRTKMINGVYTHSSETCHFFDKTDHSTDFYRIYKNQIKQSKLVF